MRPASIAASPAAIAEVSTAAINCSVMCHVMHRVAQSSIEVVHRKTQRHLSALGVVVDLERAGAPRACSRKQQQAAYPDNKRSQSESNASAIGKGR
jgi:hypothetical protein